MAEINPPATLHATIEQQNSLKSCSNCGRRFGCGMNDSSCWCSEAPQIAAEMISANKDCMCPECLNSLLTSQKA